MLAKVAGPDRCRSRRSFTKIPMAGSASRRTIARAVGVPLRPKAITSPGADSTRPNGGLYMWKGK